MTEFVRATPGEIASEVQAAEEWVTLFPASTVSRTIITLAADRVAVLPEITPKEMQALADAIPQEVMKDDREAERVWCASINGWFRSRLTTVSPDRVLKEGEVAMDAKLRDLLGHLHMVSLDFVLEADPAQRRAAAHLVQAVAGLREYHNALRSKEGATTKPTGETES